MSNPLIESLKIRLKVAIRYFSQVVHIGIEADTFRIPLVFCISQHSILFLDCEITKLLGEVFFAHLVKVVQPKDSSGDIVRFEFSDERPTGIPKKMTLITGDRIKLLKYLKCCWETDYLWRLSKACNLTIHKENIDLRKYKRKLLSNSSKEAYLSPPADYQKITHKGYGFFIPSIFSDSSIPDEYFAQENKQDYTIGIKIYDIRPVELANSDLKSFAEQFSENLSKENFVYKINSPYLKKSNLVMDIAKWEGWIVAMVSESKTIIVVLLRRKFIPPMMDSAQDIMFWCIGGASSLQICEFAADSIFSTGISNEAYKTVLTQKCEALIMDEETAAFYQSYFQLKPSKVYFGYQLLISLLQIIQKYSDEPFIRQTLKNIEKNSQAKAFQNFYEKVDYPDVIVEDFCKSSYLPSDGKGFRIWCKKVCRYLAYCIDGGLNNQLSFLNILEYFMKYRLKERDQQKIDFFLVKILDISSSVETDFEDIPSGIKKMLENSGFAENEETAKYDPFTIWKFNQKVMQGLIESGYLKKTFESQKSSKLYSKLLIFLLQKKDSKIDLKSAICKTLTNTNEQTDLSLIKNLLPHILDIFCTNNYTLATQAAVSLVNITYNNRENKLFVYNYREKVINRLSSKDPKLLVYTLLLLINLSSDQSRKKVLSRESKQFIRSLIIGNKIIKQNIEVITKSFQIFGMFCKDYTFAETFYRDEEVFRAGVDYVGENIESDLKILNFFEILCEKSQVAREGIGKLAIGKLVEEIKSHPNIEIVKKILSLFKLFGLGKDDESYQILIYYHLDKVLDGLVQNKTLTMDRNIIKQINELREILR